MRTRALQLLSLEQTMTIPLRKMCWQRAVMFVICMSIPGCLAAQTAPAKSANGTKPDPQSVPADPSISGPPVRAHDDTYIIGVDDVLSVNVWKEAEVSR